MSLPPARLFGRDDLGGLDWPATDDGDYARRYMTPFVLNGPETYIRNAHTSCYVLRVGDVLLPVSAGDFHPDNSYVCSTYTHYVSYGRQELVNLGSPPLEALLRGLLVPMAGAFRWGALDRVVFVNNWLLSTNLYPDGLTRAHAAAAIECLSAAFPDRAVVFRSLDERANPVLLAALSTLGSRLVFARSVYYQDVRSAQVRGKRQYRADLKLLEGTPYEVRTGADLSPADAERLLELYDDLYLRKYSAYNPQFTPAFIRLALAERLLTVKALCRDGRIDGVLGYVARRGFITAPLFGYDTRLPRELGLYRLLTSLNSLDALAAGQVVHLSAGVGGFKRVRGGLPAVEYNAVYDRHLPATRRIPWALLQGLMDRIAIPIVRRYGF